MRLRFDFGLQKIIIIINNHTVNALSDFKTVKSFYFCIKTNNRNIAMFNYNR